jgi:hypothetical protein
VAPLLARRFTDARQSADGAPGSDWHPATDAQRARWSPRTALAISVASPKLARILLRLWHFSDTLLCGCGGHQRPIANSVWGRLHTTLMNGEASGADINLTIAIAASRCFETANTPAEKTT